MLGGMEAALAGLKKGNGAALFGWVSAYEKNTEGIHPTGTIADLGKQAKRFQIVWKSSPIPHGPHTIRNNLDKNARLILENFLTGLDKKNPKAYSAIEANLMGGFKLIDLKYYHPVVNLIKHITAPVSADEEVVLATQQKKTP